MAYFRKKSKIIIFTIIIIFIVLCMGFVPFYNAILQPFKGQNKDYLTNYTEYDIKHKKEFSLFYNDLVNYSKYECYPTEFYYNIARKSIFWGWTSIKYNYADEAFSYVVKLENHNYDEVKQSTKNSFKYLKTQVGIDDNVQYYEDIYLKDWCFKEIFFNTEGWSDELYESQDLRDISFWFAYNDKSQEIAFHLLAPDISLDYYYNIDELKKFFSVNLYIG